MAQNNTLVYLQAKNAEFLRLKRLKRAALKLAGRDCCIALSVSF
jgi:hypothetical protein